MIRIEVEKGDGTWKAVNFLVDCGADRTVFDADLLDLLGIEASSSGENLAGVGGRADSVTLQTRIRFTKEGGGHVVFEGRFAALTDSESADMAILRRNITNIFAVIVDRPRDVVCLLGQRHSYTIIES